MNKFKSIAGVAAAALLITQPARAGETEYQEYHRENHTDLAEVVHVEPIRTTVRVATPSR